MTQDPLWNHVACLLPLSAYPFVESRHGLTVAQGSVDMTADAATPLFSLDTANSTGVTSGASGVAGTMLRLASTANFDLGTGDFTIEGWWTANVGNLVMCADNNDNAFLPYPLVERANASSAAGNWALQLSVYRLEIHPPPPDTKEYRLHFYLGDFHASLPMLEYTFASGADVFGAAGWRHFAVTRSGNRFTMWYQGVPLKTANSTVTVSDLGGDIRIGNSVFDTASNGFAQAAGRAFQGNIAQVRITKGYARYTRSFEDAFTTYLGVAPPGMPWPLAPDTGDYTGSTGPAGAAGSGPSIEGPTGEDGKDGALGVNLTLPPPLDSYNQSHEQEVRRVIADAFNGN